MEWQKGECTISTDFARLDLALMHHHLSHEAYWSPGIPLEVVTRAFQNSLAFGIYRGEEQVGWARLVTDRATFAYLADVYILIPDSVSSAPYCAELTRPKGVL